MSRAGTRHTPLTALLLGLVLLSNAGSAAAQRSPSTAAQPSTPAPTPVAQAPSRGTSTRVVTFEATVGDLSSAQPKVRARAVDLLKAAAYAEAAIPLAPLVTDPVDDIQLSAIAAELNIFLAERVTPKKRVGFVVELRGGLAAEPIFSAGPAVLSSRRVPADVAIALASASLDRTVQVAYEALYAFGALAGEATRADREVILRRTAPLFVGLIGSPDPVMRIGALRVAGRVFVSRPGDVAIDERLGDAVIGALNDRESPVRETAMWVLGQMKYERAVEGLSELMTFYRRGPLAERAFDAIARIAHEANMPQFVEQLSGKDLTLKMIAVEGIARAGDAERYAAVQTMLKTEKHEALILAGHFANVKLANGAMTTIIESLDRSRLRTQALQYIYELIPGRAAAFASAIRTSAGVRLELVDALGEAGDVAALPILQPLAADKDPNVALAAQRAIARLSS